ncbi:hypothetical protein BVU17_15985 [Haloarcula taiwanensis]|uniref:Uncharacterized protein n=1 Tax=Haloarcula taiwanensis TaxID=1932004 RepID=A0A2H5A2Y5_9EURY|nr:hypothetical protein BVU17_15985 [Haloarcula taiwanensis]
MRSADAGHSEFSVVTIDCLEISVLSSSHAGSASLLSAGQPPRTSTPFEPASITNCRNASQTDPFTSDHTSHEDEIIGTKEKTDEYACQWPTVQLVGNAVPLGLDARPVRKGEARLEIVEDVLDSAERRVDVDNVLLAREFDSQHVPQQRGTTLTSFEAGP